MHGQDVHIIIVAQGGLLFNALPEPFVIDDVIASHKARQIKGLGRGVDGGCTVSGVLAHRLGGDVPVVRQNDIRPNFVGDHKHVVLFVQLHGLLNFPAFPHAAAGIVRGAENGGVDFPFHDLPFHVLKVHTPYALGVLNQGREDDAVAVVFQA